MPLSFRQYFSYIVAVEGSGAGVKVHKILVVEHRAEIIAKSLEVGKTEEMGTNSPNLVVKQRTGLITSYLEGEETKNKDFCNFL